MGGVGGTGSGWNDEHNERVEAAGNKNSQNAKESLLFIFPGIE